MAITIVQTASGSGGSATFGSPVTKGNVILAIWADWGNQAGSEGSTIADNLGTIYGAGSAGGSPYFALFHGISDFTEGVWAGGVLTASGSCTVSLTFGAGYTPTASSLNIWEIHGLLTTGTPPHIAAILDIKTPISITGSSVTLNLAPLTDGYSGTGDPVQWSPGHTYGSAGILYFSTAVTRLGPMQDDLQIASDTTVDYSKTYSGLVAFSAGATAVCLGGGLAGLTIGCNPPDTDGVVGTSFGQTFIVSGGVPPFTFSIVSGSPPSGTTLDTSAGTLTGTLTAAGTFDFTIQVTDSTSATATADCVDTVNTGPLAISCNDPPNGTVGTPYTTTILGSGGLPPYTFSVVSGSLPPGLTLNASTGVISGTPTTPGTFPFTVGITD